MRQRLAATTAVLCLIAPTMAVRASAAHPLSAPQAAAAKKCPATDTPAVIGGKRRCLHAGEFCARRYNKDYRRYHFRCVSGRLREQ
jgi:hypothetical protein